MISESEYRRLDRDFKKAKGDATAFAEKYNAILPTENCPGCGTKDHCPGLACPECGYVHSLSWAILRDTDWGYDVVPLNKPRHVIIAGFYVKNTE